ncbi:terpene cyclase [Pleurotus pulmonarius]|nr:terpene cyclase [Pleurotus pulmonarius]
MASQYRLPNLLALCETDDIRTNPRFHELDMEFNQWLDSLTLDAAFVETLKQIQMPVLISHAYPGASLDHLRTCLDYLTLAFIFEEITDNTSSSQSQRWADIYMDMYRRTSSVSSNSVLEETGHPLFPVMTSLANNVMSSLEPIFHESFIAENLASVQAIVQEAIDREVDTPSRQPRTLKAYYTNRLATVGLMPFLILAQWTGGIRLPVFLQDSLSVQEMSQAAIEMVFLSNDIYSFKKEKMAGATQNNVITAIIQDPLTSICEGDLQGSFDYSKRLFQEALARFLTHKELLLENVSDHKGCSIEVNKLSQAMMDCVVGNIKWSMVCRRYAVFGCEQARNANEVVIV